MKKITIALVALLANLATAQDGVLDTSFGTGGFVLVNTDNGASFGKSVQPDGTTIYIQGTQFRRLSANGTPDTTFGTAGAINIVQPGVTYEGFTVAGNQITLVAKGNGSACTMGRYNFDGTVDATLGTSGQGYITLNQGDNIDGHVVTAPSPDGKILIGGNSETAFGSYNNYYVRRYNSDGSNDNTYNFNAYQLGINVWQTPIGYPTTEWATGLKVRPDGKAVIFGYSDYQESSSSFISYRRATGAIINPANGDPVKLQHSYGAYGGLKSDLAFDTDNNVYFLGGQTFYNNLSNPTNGVQKFTAAGSAALSFGTNSTLTLALDIDATTKADFRQILIQPDGKILLAGMAAKTNALSDFPYLILARYLQDGTIDTTFGTNGYVLHDIAHPNTNANRNNLTRLYASADFSSIYMCGNNMQNAIVLKFSNISMTPLTIPAFTAIAPICAGDSTPTLSVVSTNGVTGTWSPATIDNMASATYTFTPDAGQHAATATLSVTVNQPTSSSVSETACENYTWAANGMVYTQSGAYTHVTTNAAGCTHTTTLNLTINQNTTANVNATACNSYTWSATGTTYTQSGNYAYVTTNAAGCTHTTTLNLTLNQSVAVSGAANQTFTQGATLGSVVVSPTTVVWYASEEDALVPQNPIAGTTVLANGTTYYAVHTTAQGCVSAPFAVTVTTTLITAENDKPAFQYFPNPVKDKLNVVSGMPINLVEVFTISGQKVLQQNTGKSNATEYVFDISGLAAGTYIMQVSASGNRSNFLVVKE